MIYNDHQKYTTALLTVHKKEIEVWASNGTVNSLEAIHQKIRQEMLLFSKQPEFKDKFPGKWIPANFQIIADEFSEENKMINSTLKMVRHKITETYQERLDLMYAKKGQQLALDENIKVLSSFISLKDE